MWRSLFVPPSLDRSVLLPATLAMLLLAALVYQVRATPEETLPDAGPVARDGRPAAPVVLMPATPDVGVIVARSMFTPAGKPATAADAPLAGVSIAGSIRIGNRLFAVVQGPDAGTRTVALGGKVGDWTLYRLIPDAAVLRHGRQQITKPFGTRATLPPTAAASRSP